MWYWLISEYLSDCEVTEIHRNRNALKFKVLKDMAITVAVFWGATSWSLLDSYLSFGRMSSTHFQCRRCIHCLPPKCSYHLHRQHGVTSQRQWSLSSGWIAYCNRSMQLNKTDGLISYRLLQTPRISNVEGRIFYEWWAMHRGTSMEGNILDRISTLRAEIWNRHLVNTK